MKISIIIPYKEDRGYLSEAVESCQHQKGFTLGMDYEVILSQGDAYIGVNINKAVKRAKGKYIKILAEDDQITSECLHILYKKAEEGYDLVCADALNVFPDRQDRESSHIPGTVRRLAMKNTIHGGTTLYRRATMPQWDGNMWTAEEYELHLRMAAMGLRFGYTPGVVYLYRRHDKQKSLGGAQWLKSPDGEYRFEYLERIQNQYLNNGTIIAR